MRVKAGAEVLLRDADGNPLLCVQRSGAGRVVCVLTDTTSRWSFTEADTQDQHRRFWRQVLLWAGGMDREPREKFRIALGKTQAMPGEPVTIEARLSEPGGEPIRDANVTLEVTTPDGESVPVACRFSRERGLFEAQYTVPAPGDYAVRARASRAGEPVGEDVAFFQASSADRELEDPAADLGLLRSLSAATAEAGGRYYPYANAHDLLRELADGAQPLKLTTRRWRDVWDGAPLFAVFLLALAAEWGLRRRKGLL